MKRLYLFLFFVQLVYSQDDSLSFNPDSLETANVSTDTLSQVSAETISEESPAVLDPSIPLTIDAGYKGFLWGSSFQTTIITNFTKINKPDTSSMVKSFVGNLGPDSAHVHYFFADSGFWKVEIDFVIHDLSVEKQVQTFLRHEKNISEVYGPPSKINHKESGVSSAYSNLLDQRFSNAFYRSSWKAEPAVIELYLNSSVLLPKSDVSIFSGNYSILKLVYYNPDYMYSSSPAPPSQELPSIFEIY